MGLFHDVAKYFQMKMSILRHRYTFQTAYFYVLKQVHQYFIFSSFNINLSIPWNHESALFSSISEVASIVIINSWCNNNNATNIVYLPKRYQAWYQQSPSMYPQGIVCIKQAS